MANSKSKTILINEGEQKILSQKAGTTLKFNPDGAISTFNYTKASDNSRDLLMSYTTIEKMNGEVKETTVRIKNFFSADGKKNISSFKDVIIDDDYFAINAFIDGFEYNKADKKGVIQGSDFADTIYGTAGNDKIYTNGGGDTVYSSKGNDSIYSGKGGMMYVVGEDIGNTKIYNSIKGDVLNFKNATEIRYEKVDNDLDINGVVIKDWFKKNNGQFDKMLSDVKDSGGVEYTIDKNTTIIQDYMPENKKQKIYGINNMNSEIIGSNYNDTITSNTLSDTIYGNGGNDVIYANAKGDNETTVAYNDQISEDGVYVPTNVGNDTVYLNMKSDGTNTGSLLLNIANLSYDYLMKNGVSLERKGNDIILKMDDVNGITGSLILKDYLKTAKTVYFGLDRMKTLADFINEYYKNDFLNVNFQASKKGQTINGTWLDDTIYGSSMNDKIYTNGGNDKVSAGKGNDSIYVGSGESDIYFYSGDGRDTIYMTKDTGTVRLRTLNDADVLGNVEYTRKGNDLLINRNKWKSSKEADILTIKDYFKQTEEHFYRDEEALKDTLNNSGFGEQIRTISASNKNKSATLSGTFLNDTITGSNKNDKIYTGGGYDIVTAGKGNDTIYVDGGDVTLNLNRGDGFDTVYLRKPQDLTKLTLDFGDELSIRGYERSANGKDLLINYQISEDGEYSGKYDRITIKDFFKQDESVRNKIYYKYQGYEDALSNGYDFYIAMFGKTNSSNKITDSAYRDIIYAGDKNDTIISNSGNDEITGNKGNDRIILAGEDNKELLFQNGDGSDTIITKDLHNATIYVDSLEYSENGGFKAYKTSDGDIVVGDFGGYTTNKESYKNQTGLSFDDYYSELVEYGKTYDISNSKMFFEKFLRNNEELGENKNNISFRDNNMDFDNLGEYITKTNGTSWDNDANKEIGAFVGTDNDDYIIASNKTDVVDAGAGDDIIVVNKGKHYIYGRDGNDTLVIKDLNSLNYASSIETIQYNGNLKDLYLAFHVNADGTREEYGGLGIGNSSIYSQLTSFKFKNGTWFGSDSEFPKALIVANKYGLNAKKIDFKSMLDIITKNVANYLKSKGYDSTMDLMANSLNKSKKAYQKDLDGLIKIYKQGIASNDVVEATEEHYDVLQAGAGNDKYVVAKDLYLNKDITIDDLSGKNDTLELTDVEKDDVHIMADIKLKTDKKGNIMRDKKGNILYTLSDNDLLLSSEFSNDFSEEAKGTITIKDYFKNGKIENIKLGDGAIYNVNAKLREIAEWLANSGFKSLREAMDVDYNATLDYLNDEKNHIFSNNIAKTIGTDEDDVVVVKNTKNNVFTVDLKNGNDTLEIKNSTKTAIVDMGAGNKTISTDVKNLTINGQNADSLLINANWSSNKKGSFNITGSNGDDRIFTFNCDATINAGAGNDVLSVYENVAILNSDLDGGDGDDKYFINSFRGKHTITDSSGNDELIFTNGMQKENIHFVFNVKADGTFDEEYDNLLVLNDETYAKWCKGEKFDNGLTINGFDTIEKIATGYYDEKYDENGNPIYDENGKPTFDTKYDDVADLNKLRESVAGWLSTNGYADVNEVFNSEKTDGDIEALIAKFNDVNWQPQA